MPVRNLSSIMIAQSLHDDDSIFLPIADFLTLLSIAFIFVALQYGVSPTIGAESSVQVMKTSRSSVPAQTIDETIVYVAVIPRLAGLQLRIVPSGSGIPANREVDYPISEALEAEVITWAQLQVAQLPEIKTVVLDLESNGATGPSYQLVVKLANVFRTDYDVKFSP